MGYRMKIIVSMAQSSIFLIAAVETHLVPRGYVVIHLMHVIQSILQSFRIHCSVQPSENTHLDLR